jgi:hypothetical protein
MKHLLVLLFLAMFAEFALAQTSSTYTVTKDGGGAKANGFFTLNVNDEHGKSTTIEIDNRSPSRTGYLDIGPFGQLEYHGIYSFPTQSSHSPFYGVATYVSDDSMVKGEFQVYAYYVSVCSGRGCGGTLGWHYRVLMGSRVSVN